VLPSFCIIIPARYASTRFPGKPLADLGGKSMLQRVWEAAGKIPQASGIYIATDDQRIHDHAAPFAPVILTDPSHPSGTDRCAEALKKAGIHVDVVVNLQGDEPFIIPGQVTSLVSLFQDPEVQIATLKKAIENPAEKDDPNVVKVVTSVKNRALYFSRSPIPFLRDPGDKATYFRHIGMYAYRSTTLEEITALPPSDLEKTEKLEQLRWLENGYHIAVAETDWQSPAVDTPEDLERARLFLKEIA
jgi:3-deoxy-manno-octulosonate cytidylyltransferase (CMP-KDO synthetase)